MPAFAIMRGLPAMSGKTKGLASQSATDAGIQLPWKPFGTRGSSIDATGSLSIVAASMMTKRLLSEWAS